MSKSEKCERIHQFQNPLAVIQAAVDLLNKDPDNLEKILMVCKIINQQASIMSEEVGGRLEQNLAKKA